MTERTAQELEDALADLLSSPSDNGRVELVVRRPDVDKREVLEAGELDLYKGLVGDSWLQRGNDRSPDGAAHPDKQLNVINARVSAFLAVDPRRRELAGDQLHLDLDLSAENLPPGTRLSIGSAVIEVTAEPHRGCKKFGARFGLEALRFVNAPDKRDLRLRGLNARIVMPGTVRPGDKVTKLAA